MRLKWINYLSLRRRRIYTLINLEKCKMSRAFRRAAKYSRRENYGGKVFETG